MITVREDIAALQATVGDSTGGMVKDVDSLKTTVGGNSSGLVKKVNTVESTVGDANSGLVKDVAALKNLVSDDGTTKMLFGMVVTIDGTTGAVSLSEPQAEA